MHLGDFTRLIEVLRDSDKYDIKQDTKVMVKTKMKQQ